MSGLVLYTRAGCPLCDKVEAVLRSEEAGYEAVDIGGDPGLEKEYGWLVPVLERGGEVIFEAGMDPGALPGLLRRGI